MLNYLKAVRSAKWIVTAACAVTVMVVPICAAAGVKSEEPFDDWIVRTLETPAGQLTVGLTTASKEPLNGIAISCEAGKPISMGVFGKRSDGGVNSLKDMAAEIKVKVTVGKNKISSEWRGMMIPVGYSIFNDDADALIQQMKGKAIDIQVNGVKSSFSLSGFSEGLVRFKEVCSQINQK